MDRRGRDLTLHVNGSLTNPRLGGPSSVLRLTHKFGRSGPAEESCLRRSAEETVGALGWVH